ncbi:alpha/beta fold hydrolase [Sphingomonas hengshuiensis]|uniref:Alpha/beta hydrolase n=1 Tax=Sphingomonas hengshuiensis TaxID=1609977 RepID=A0A7U4JA65_9SPHN|nr:alpha/beta hydrolase [Sphingomonas hengshuiensis]AJP72997.1 alpha/beta hydrolase [Sphingomonas hengshuiensis]
MIRQLTYAALAAVTIPAMLNPAPAKCQSATAAAAPIQMEHISVEVTGKGSPVILIPGLTTPRAVWDGVAPDLARTHKVYLVQVNGFGGDDPRANLKPGMLAGAVAELHALIVREKLAGAAVVGHSMGGLAGLLLAKAHPGDVGKLMVVDALPYVGVIFAPGATVAMIEPTAVAIRDQFLSQYGKPQDPAAAAGVAATQAMKPESRAQVAKWIAAADPRVTGLAFYDDATTDLRPDLAGIATPITLVYPWGGRLPKERADALYHGEYASAPQVRFVDVGDSGHFVMLDQPEAFRAALAAFLG